MAAPYWYQRFTAATGEYQCPGCNRDLKPKMSNSAKNPGRTFVSCNKDFGGCGLFSFVDEEPRFLPGQKPPAKKRERSEEPSGGGTNVIGPVVNRPEAHEHRLADLAAEIAGLRADIKDLPQLMRELKEYLDK